MKFNNDQFICDYITKGAYCFDASDIMAKINIDAFKPAEAVHPDGCFHAEGFDEHSNYQENAIEQLSADISSTYLKEMNHVLVFDFLAFAVNQNVQKWHNDAQYNMEDQNTSVNCFFDDTAPYLGGCFEIMQWSPQPRDDDPNIHCIYPKKNSIIIFNQNRNFIHKATPSINPRRMVSFGCTLKDINPLVPNFSVI